MLGRGSWGVCSIRPIVPDMDDLRNPLHTLAGTGHAQADVTYG